MEWGRQEGEKTTGRGRNHGGVGKTRPDARPAGSGGRDGIPPRPFRNIRKLFRKFGKSSVSRPFRMTNAPKLPQMNRQPSCIRVYFFSPLQYTAQELLRHNVRDALGDANPPGISDGFFGVSTMGTSISLTAREP